MQAGAAIASLARTQSNSSVFVDVLAAGLHDADQERILSGAGDLSVRFHDADLTAVHEIEVASYLTKTTLLRLTFAEIIGLRDGRVIYLDADTIVRTSLVDLWQLDLLGGVVGAVRDPVIPWAGAPGCLDVQSLRLDPSMPYHNSGVLLIDVEMWRRERVQEETLRVLRERPLRYADQCALNIAIGSKVTSLHPKYNLQVGHLVPDQNFGLVVEGLERMQEAIAEPAIVHFNSGSLGRPWLSGCTHPRAHEWFESLHRTAWGTWCPTQRPTPTIQRLRRRLIDTGREFVRTVR